MTGPADHADAVADHLITLAATTPGRDYLCNYLAESMERCGQLDMLELAADRTEQFLRREAERRGGEECDGQHHD